jgi:hypothetical protein
MSQAAAKNAPAKLRGHEKSGKRERGGKSQ